MPIEKIVVNRGKSVRYASMAGRDYMVVPMTMLVEGVHNGSQGPLYYPAEELEKLPAVWNHKPLVVYHPEQNGNSISACDPDVITSQGVGVVMNTKWVPGTSKQPGKLKAEAWFEVDRLKAVDERVLNAIQKNQEVEISTGLFTENEAVPGEWQGKAYSAIARNYKPDHLAILPDVKGACSCDAGCGLLKNEDMKNTKNADGECDCGAKEGETCNCKNNKKKMPMTANAKSYGNISNDLYAIIRNKYGDNAWVQDVYSDFVIYENAGKLFKQSYNLVDNKTELADSPAVEVVRVTEYQTVSGEYVGNASSRSKEKSMTKKELVDGLIANHGWKEEERETLMGFTEDRLGGLVPQPKQEPAPKSEPTANQDPVTIEAYVANAPEGIREMLVDGINSHRQAKAALVAEITANKANVFTAERLGAMGIDQLRGIAALAKAQQTTTNNKVNFAGAATPATNQTTEQAALPLPVMNYGKA